MKSPRLNSVTVRVPGSTSNCGAGFDTLGLALQLYNEVTLTRAPRGMIEPAGGDSIRGLPLVRAALDVFNRRTGGAAKKFGFTFAIGGDVPIARGLGSSVTVIAGVLAALNELAAAGLTRREIAEMAAAVEGHPDNATAGVFGGFCVGRTDPATGALLGAIRIAVPAGLSFVVCSPALEMPTKKARAVLPQKIRHADAVRSINSAAYLTAAFATRDYARLRHAVADFMHEPFRLPRIPGARAAITAGIDAGALTGWLSGSGSSVLCVVRGRDTRRTGRAMAQAFAGEKISSRVFVLRADNRGLRVTRRRR